MSALAGMAGSAVNRGSIVTNRGWAMGTIYTPVANRFEENILRFFSPNGLLTVVCLIILIALFFGGTGIEHRTMDTPAVDHLQTTVSPLLHSTR